MNVFEACLPKRTGRRIYLPEDEEEDEDGGCFSCCVLKTRYTTEGIRLPEGGSRRTIDDYLDPRSPVSIEVLLAEQEEELDQYLHDEDTFISKRKNSVASHLFLEDDAQFLSEHRISAILVDRPKLGSANMFQPSEQPKKSPQELLDVVMPVASTSTSSISSRVFAIKTRPQELISDAPHITQSPMEIKNVAIPSPSSSTSSLNAAFAPAVVGSSNSLAVFPVASSSNRTTEFPATMLTRSPYTSVQPPIAAPSPPILGTGTTGGGRRPSVVSILGDKLDDFTERLALMKKNMIKSLDSDDEEEMTENPYPKSGADGREISGTTKKWDTFVLPKFKKSAADAHAVPRSVTQDTLVSSDEDDDDDFDFSEVGKNVRNFSEGVMGNGLRILNNLSTRIKNQK